MKKKIKTSKNQENIVSHTANQHRVTKWDSLKKRLADLTRTVIAMIKTKF